METKCNLIIDSCCELPKSIIERDDIELINYSYTIDGVEYVDDMYETISAKEFYDAMRNGAEPQTAQLPPKLVHDKLEEAVAKGKPTVFLSFSSGLTGTVDNVSIILEGVKQEHPEAELYLVDTLQASTTEALYIYEAIAQRDKGLTAKELVDWAEEAKHFVNCRFMVDDLEALRRGGRIPASLAAVGSKLDIKPLLTIGPDGKLSMCGIAKGRKKAIKQMVSFFIKSIPEGNRGGRLIALGQADCSEDYERLKEMLHKVDSGIEFLETDIGPVIGSHVGPNMLSMVFWGPDIRK